MIEPLLPTERERDYRWQDDAVCASIGGDLWFPEMGQSSRAAQKICRTCPVQAQCLGYALDNYVRDGVWGGATREDRRQLWRERGTEVPDETDNEECARCPVVR